MKWKSLLAKEYVRLNSYWYKNKIKFRSRWTGRVIWDLEEVIIFGHFQESCDNSSKFSFTMLK